MVRRKNHFPQLLNVHRVSYVRQIEIHTAKPLVPEPSAFEFEMATEKLKQHKSPGTDRIPTDRIKAGGRQFAIEIIKLIHSIWNEEEMSEEWNDSINVQIYKKGDTRDCSNLTF